MREQEKIAGAVSMFTMVNDWELMIEDIDVLKRLLNLMFNGYEAQDWKINAEGLDIFLTTFMSIDPKQFYKRKLKFESDIITGNSK